LPKRLKQHEAASSRQRIANPPSPVRIREGPLPLPVATATVGTARHAAEALHLEAVRQGAGNAPPRIMRGEKAAQAALLRDILGPLPFRPVTVSPSWLSGNGGTVAKLAAAIYEERRFADLPILADALEDAGCTDAAVLAHCRGPGEHVRGCWAVDLLTGRE
jgi:hypothetical protein